jgi:hypothetical protein
MAVNRPRPLPRRPAAGTAQAEPRDRLPKSGPAAVLALQRAAGNAAVSGLVARRSRTAVKLPVQRGHTSNLSDHGLSADQQQELPDPATAKTLNTEFQQLQQKWIAADAAVKAAKKAGRTITMEDSGFTAADDTRLREVMRLLNLRKRGDEADTLTANRIPGGLAAWFAQVSDVRFLGRTVRVHQLLADRLALAEAALATETPPQGGWLAGNPSGLREPGQGLHSFGLAIDLNGSTNPWLVSPEKNRGDEPAAQAAGVRAIIDRANLLVLGRTPQQEDFSSRPAVPDRDQRVEASYTKLQEASQALERYFTLTAPDKADELAELITGLGAANPAGRTADQVDQGDIQRELAKWVAVIAADRTKLAGYGRAKGWASPEKGFLHLDKRLVKAMTNSSGAGLTWLGDDTIASGRDIMHFDMRGIGTISQIVDSLKGTRHLGSG